MKQVLLLLLAGLAFPAFGQSGSVPVRISFSDPLPPGTSCSISGEGNLAIALEQPVTGSVSVNVSALTGGLTVTPSSHRPTPTYSVGTFGFVAANARKYTISIAPDPLPTTLTSVANSAHTLPFSLSTARSDDAGSTWKAPVSGEGGNFDHEYHPRAPGLFRFDRQYRIGGQISGITLSTPRARYTASITFRFTCSDS